jgi:hypothetical protein
MHPEGVPLFLAVNECDPFRVGEWGSLSRGPGVTRRAEVCDPFRVEDGAEKDANNG